MDIEKFINDNIIKHDVDFFKKDIDDYNNFLKDCIQDKEILIIGGAGTIGSHYIKEILPFKPSKIVIVDNNENGLTELTRDLRSDNLLDYNPTFITYPINLLSNTFDKIFKSGNFQIVANFSAHKHVRSEKDVISIEGLLINNVYGAIKLLNLCSLNPPDYFFSVSTDKATNPVNIMGASKALMEKLIISQKNKFRVSTARFANVAFSNGSLLQGYINRLDKLQPLSCPSDIKRFFVTPKQSGQICLLATFLGKSGDIFFPKLDFEKDQVFFKDITLKFIHELGYKPFLAKTESEAKKFNINKRLYPVYFFETNTSGEKSYEEFYDCNDIVNLKAFKSMGLIKPLENTISFDNLKTEFDELFKIPDLRKKDIVKLLKSYVPDFQHIETNKSLDSKM